MICVIRSSIFRHLPLFHHIQSSVGSQITARFKHAILNPAYIAQTLGIPPRPKKPLAPYFRYLIEIRPSVMAEHPKLHATEYAAIITKMWHSLDNGEKEKYKKSFGNDQAAYTELLVDYNKRVSKADRRKITETQRQLKDEIEKRKYIRSQRKKASEFERPKKPLSGFLKFMKEKCDRQPNEKQNDYLRRKSSEFKCLSDSEKEHFKMPVEEFQKYQEDLLKWKGKIMKLGNYNLLRSEIPNYTNFDDILSSEKKS